MLQFVVEGDWHEKGRKDARWKFHYMQKNDFQLPILYVYLNLILACGYAGRPYRSVPKIGLVDAVPGTLPSIADQTWLVLKY